MSEAQTPVTAGPTSSWLKRNSTRVIIISVLVVLVLSFAFGVWRYDWDWTGFFV